MLYGQGGAIWSKVEATINGFGGGFCGFNGITCDFGSASKTRTGWTIGGGVEWMFAPHWSAFLEGNYYDFGNNNRTITTRNFFPNTPVGFVGCDLGFSFNTKATAATVLVGVNYRWGWGKSAVRDVLTSTLPKLELTRPRASSVRGLLIPAN